MTKNINVLFVMLIMIGMFIPELVEAAVKLPSWASGGNLQQDMDSTGKRVADIISGVVGILGVLGMLVGAACFPLNKPDLGKQFVVGSGIGLTVAALVYGIAALFIK